MPYSVGTEIWSGEQVVALNGPNGRRAVVAPWGGANLIALALVAAQGEQAVELLDTPPSADALRQTPTKYGSPVLFPFPGRIAGSTFAYDGKEYRIDPPADGGLARHGFVLKALFNVGEMGADADSAWVTMSFQGDSQEILRQFPSAFRLEMTFRLNNEGLDLSVKARNVGERRLPMGFGWHPYFRMPLGPAGKREACRLRTSCQQFWELGADLAPTGNCLPVTGKLDLRLAPQVGEAMYDNVLTTAVRDERGWMHASLLDEANRLEVTVSAGPSYREWVIYTPPGRNAVCLEPYTCPPDAFNIEASGRSVGVIHLEPGEEWQEEALVRLARL